MLDILPKVSSLPSLLAKRALWKWMYRFFKRSRDLTLFTWSKGHVWEPLPQFAVYRSSAGGDIYFICHVIAQDYFIIIIYYYFYFILNEKRNNLSCIFMGESSSQYATTLKSLVIIDILKVKRKNASSKTWIL